MTTSQFLLTRSIRSFLLMTFITSLMIFLSSCGGGKVKPLVNNDNCITLSRSAINTNMLAGSWSVPGSRDFIPYIYFMPAKNGADISVSAEPADRNNLLYASRRVNLSILGSLNPPCSFPAGLTIGTNRYDFSAMDFADDRGRLKDFDFLRFVPRACTDSGYTNVMVFDVFAVTNKGGVETVEPKGSTKPCPPYCPALP